ncbi:hypothetical protein JOQ06_013885, partial [Pogonophryne albipinna]
MNAHLQAECDRLRQREDHNTLAATPKRFLQHSTDNQKILAAGGGAKSQQRTASTSLTPGDAVSFDLNFRTPHFSSTDFHFGKEREGGLQEEGRFTLRKSNCSRYIIAVFPKVVLSPPAASELLPL